MSRTLVVYYSATGTTERVAKNIAEATSATLCPILLAKPYTAEELNWQDPNSRCSVEMADPSTRPEITTAAPALDGYDTIFVGFPVWWDTAPHAVLSFLDTASLAGKKMVIFITSVQSTAEKSLQDLRGLYPSAIWAGAARLHAEASMDEVKAFVAAY